MQAGVQRHVRAPRRGNKTPQGLPPEERMRARNLFSLSRSFPPADSPAPVVFTDLGNADSCRICTIKPRLQAGVQRHVRAPRRGHQTPQLLWGPREALFLMSALPFNCASALVGAVDARVVGAIDQPIHNPCKQVCNVMFALRGVVTSHVTGGTPAGLPRSYATVVKATGLPRSHDTGGTPIGVHLHPALTKPS